MQIPAILVRGLTVLIETVRTKTFNKALRTSRDVKFQELLNGGKKRVNNGKTGKKWENGEIDFQQ
jgi:phage host-nuclease inhibitor protein Gam